MNADELTACFVISTILWAIFVVMLIVDAAKDGEEEGREGNTWDCFKN